MVNRRTFVTVVGGGIAASATLALGGTILARQATPDATPAASPADGGAPGGMPPLPAGAVPVAQGLWNPQDLAFGPDGTLYIAENGIAGGGGEPGTMATPGPDGTPVTASPMIVPSQLSAVAPDGTQAVLTTEAGGVGIGYYDGEVFLAQGGGSVGTGFTPLPAENTVSAYNLETKAVRVVASLGPYEAENNPDGLDVNPNLYGMAISADGQIYQVDAGGNTIYKIDAKSGEFSLFAVVPNLTDLTGATPTAEEQAQQPGPRQPVPTSVVLDADSTVTVTLLGEGWPGPSILNFAADGSSYTEGISGLSMIVNSALGPDGLLYVSQLTSDMSTGAPGAVLRINADGSVEPVVEGLLFPHGIAFSTEGHLFVATNSIISTPEAPMGMVLRFDNVGGASPAASPAA